MPTAISSSTWNVELRDKNGNLKKYLTPFISEINWEWNRMGGCGSCSFTIQKPYRDISFDARDDIQIRIKNEEYMDIATKLLIHFDGADEATTYTAETGQTVTFEGTAQLDTAQKKFGTASLLLDGNSDYVTVPDSADWNFGTGDFTIDLYIKFADLTGQQNIVEQRQDADNLWFLYKSSTNRIAFNYLSGGTILAFYYTTEADVVSVDTWHHIALVRSGGSIYIFIDGVSKALTINTAIASSTNLSDISSDIHFGTHPSSGSYVNGWLDEVRVSKGIARWTSNFNIPIKAYSTNAPSKLVYRGFIANAVPTLSDQEKIVVNVKGYFDLLKKIVVNDAGDTLSYSSSELSVIVEDIIDTFVTPNTPITKGTIDVGTFEADSIQFLTTVEDALNTLANLAGDVEYGVDEDLVFFWRTESSSIRKKFMVGDNVQMLERKVDYDKLMNKAYLVGGTVLGSKYKRTAENTDSQSQYYLSEKIYNNGSIISDTVADQYLGSLLRENAGPQLAIRARIVNTALRLEDTVPIGLIVFYDVNYDRNLLTDTTGDIIGAEVAIVSSSVANPSVITATEHGMTTGDTLIIAGHVYSDPDINGSHVITGIDANSFSIPVNVTTGGVGGTATTSPDTGDNLIIGLEADGGDDVIIGGQYSAQVDRIQYTPSQTEGRCNLTIQFGDTILDTAAIIKKLDLALANLQQY